MRLYLLVPAMCVAVFSACGTGEKEKKEPEQLDPYRSLMSERVNEVIYSGKRPAKVMEELALLGIAPGKDFEEFKEESKIDDWFTTDEAPVGPVRYTSLTCGLSPVVDGAGEMVRFYRNRKMIEGEMEPELFLGPGDE